MLYVVINSLLVMAFNALSIGYGPQGLRPLLLDSPLPVGLLVLLIPFLTAVSLVRLGVRPPLIWAVPALGMLLETPVAGLVTTTLPMNLPEAITGQQIDLMPSVSPDLGQVLFILLMKALAVGVGLGSVSGLFRAPKWVRPE